MDCRRARELLPGLVDNELSPSGRASLLEHLNQCQSCQAEWQSLRSVIRMVRSLPEVTPPSDFRNQLYRRLHNEPVIAKATTKATSRGRWYQWSVAAAAVLALVWSVRFASVKPPYERPTDLSGISAVGPTSTGSSEGQTSSHPATEPTAKPRPTEVRDGDAQDAKAAGAYQTAPESELPSVGASSRTLKSSSPEPTFAATAVGVPPAVSPPVSTSQQSPPDKDTQAQLADRTAQAAMQAAAIQKTPNPSFTAPRNSIDSNRHREGMSGSVAEPQVSVDLNSSSTPRPEECVTRLRISGPGPDEVRQWLRQLSQSERLVLVELQPTSRTVQFSIRGSADQITRIASQISTLVTVLQRETMVVDLKREWTAIQELIGQARLEISRREEILRQTKVELEIQQQEAELENSRNQLRNQEKTLRLLESRLGTAVLEIRY